VGSAVDDVVVVAADFVVVFSAAAANALAVHTAFGISGV
jgi:hypothetical protein